MRPLPGPERWQLIAPILEKALEMPPEKRGAFLDRACAGDPGLRAEVQALLAADSDAGSFLGAPVELSVIAPGPGEAWAGAAEGSAGPGHLAGTTIGTYRVVREIGRGGMGVVYEAEQQRPRRPVALKVILGGLHVDPTTVRMFQREAESLARLKHPAIAAIYESGSTADGQPFLTMELVQGPSLSAYLEQTGVPRTRPDLRRRLALFRKIAGAVAYAHQRGVIHRDLKPSNILIVQPAGVAAAGSADAAGSAGAPVEGAAPERFVSSSSGDLRDEVPEIKVLDFGLARITDPGAEAAATSTALGRIRGTLPYMSPEQVRGRGDEVDIRTDVYALGVILYRMLTGRLPYDLEDAGYPEAARVICEEPPRPLVAAAGGGVKIDRDLSIVVLKALEKSPGRRYATVSALDEDVARYLAGQPILARPPSAAYQIRKLVTRHRVPFAAAGAGLVLLVGFAILMAVQARRIAAERDRANREAATAGRISSFLTDLFRVSDPGEARGNNVRAREILDKGVGTIGQELAGDPEIQARMLETMGKVYTNLGLYGKAGPLLEQAVAIERRLHGEADLRTAAALDLLAQVTLNAGRWGEAEKLFGRILDLRRRLQGEDHPDVLESMYGLACVYGAQGRFAEQEALHRRVLEARRRVLGEDDRATLKSMVGLAGALDRLRRYPESEALHRAVLEKQRRVLGEDHPDTLTSLQNLAVDVQEQGRHAEAESLYDKALEGMRRVLGEEHPMTLLLMNNLADLYDREGRSGEAEKLERHVLEVRRRTLGEDHPDTLYTMNNLANFLLSQNRYADAEPLYRETLEKQRRLLGVNHPDTALTLYNLACLSALRGNRQAALYWLGQAVTHGYSHAEQIAVDSDLKPLRGDPAFEALIVRAREQAKRAAGQK